MTETMVETKAAWRRLSFNFRIYLCLVLVNWIVKVIPANAKLEAHLAILDLNRNLDCAPR